MTGSGFLVKSITMISLVVKVDSKWSVRSVAIDSYRTRLGINIFYGGIDCQEVDILALRGGRVHLVCLESKRCVEEALIIADERSVAYLS